MCVKFNTKGNMKTVCLAAAVSKPYRFMIFFVLFFFSLSHQHWINLINWLIDSINQIIENSFTFPGFCLNVCDKFFSVTICVKVFPSLLSKNLWLFFMGLSKIFFFFKKKKKFKMGDPKKPYFSKPIIYIIFFRVFLALKEVIFIFLYDTFNRQ